MVGVEVLVGYLVAWGVRKARRAGQAVSGEADRLLDAGLDQLHQTVTGLLGDESPVAQVEAEARESGQVSRATQARMGLALEEVLVDQPDAEARLVELLERLRQAEAVAGVRLVSSVSGGVSIGGNAQVHAEHGAVAAIRTGDITMGAPIQPHPQWPGSVVG